jgi:hypothetical protein
MMAAGSRTSQTACLLRWPQNEGHHKHQTSQWRRTRGMLLVSLRLWLPQLVRCHRITATFLNRQYDVSNLRMIEAYKFQAVICGSETDMRNKERDILQWSTQKAKCVCYVVGSLFLAAPAAVRSFQSVICEQQGIGYVDIPSGAKAVTCLMRHVGLKCQTAGP